MKVTKQSAYSQNKTSYMSEVDNDLINIFTAFKGRVRFGDVSNGYRGENLSGEYRIFTSVDLGDGNFGLVVTHTLNATPVGFILINKNELSDIHMDSATDTTATFHTETKGTSFTVFLLK